MSIYLAIQTIYKTLDSLITFFATDKDAKSKGWNKKLIQHDFIATTYMMMDVLPIVTELCLVFQKADLDVSMVKVTVDHAKESLKKMKSDEGGDGTYLKQLKEDHLTVEGGKTYYKGNHLVQGRKNIDSIKQKFINALLEKLDKRFPEDDSNVIYAFAVLAMRPISFCSQEELSVWGDEKLEVLIKHYGESKKAPEHAYGQSVTTEAIIDGAETKKEWSLIKKLVLQEGFARDSMGGLWSMINSHFKDRFPNLITLAALALTAPIHTADCERGFSAQNQTKTPMRNRLSPERLDDLLIIKLEAGDMKEFDFMGALEHWRAAKQRKLFN